MTNGFIVQDYMRNTKRYDGNTLKFGITVDNTDFIVKGTKDSISSIYSEYVASRFICSLGISCHEAYLGYYQGQLVVILRDFAINGKKLRSYKSIRQSSEGTDLSNKNYTYTDVIYLINKHTKMSDENKRKSIQQFWDMFICDAILANRDRHHGNWGYLTSKKGYTPAPIYDNGGSLFPNIDKNIQKFKIDMENNNCYSFIAERSEKFPASFFQRERGNGEIKRTNYYEILSDLRINKTLTREVKALRQKVGFNQIYENIFRITCEVRNIIPYEYRIFYILIVCTRYLHMIEREPIKKSYMKSYRRLCNEVRTYL